MFKRFFLFLMACGTLTASASTITFQPTSQTINLGTSTTVDVMVSGLTSGQALGAFDLFVLNNSSILTATKVTYFSFLGDPSTELTGSTLLSGSTEGSEVSFETTGTLLGLQTGQPFSLFELTYKGIGVGTSSLTLGLNPEILADGSGKILPAPTVVAGSITVINPMSVTPEPSTFALLGTGCGYLAWVMRRRRIC